MSTAVASTSHTESPYGHANKRKRSQSPQNRNGTPPAHRRRSQSPPGPSTTNIPKITDDDPVRRKERERQLALRLAEVELEEKSKSKNKEKEKEKPEFDPQAEFQKLISSRSGGVYMPPARLRAMQEAASQNKSSPEYQRLHWDALRKSITGIVNRVNITNIKHVVPELFAENLIRGRGLFARSIMKAQGSSLPFTPVFAALVSVINTKLPQVGELLLMRLVSQFRRSFKRNDKTICHSTTTFIAHLVNQSVAHEIIALQIMVLLLERPTDDSIEVAVGFMREVGAYLTDNSPKANSSVFERFRAVLNEGSISQRVQYMIEVLMQVRKDKYKDNPIIPEGLDLVEEEEQITHQVGLDDELQIQDGLNIFKFDPNFIENEEKYKQIKNEILGEGSDDDDESGSEEDSDEEEEPAPEKEGIEDRTSTNLVNLRRTIYLTIMNALNYEEAVHKLLKVQLSEGEEIELVKMVIECCSQERSYSKFYGLIGERFSKLNRIWTDAFEQAFRDYYETIHRYETNRLRNIARFFGHLIASDAISWAVLEVVRMNEDDTTSSSRIFIKLVFEEMGSAMGIKTVSERFKDEEVKRHCMGMFPMDNPKNTRFAINYFTSIGFGGLTEEMREHLKNAPRIIMEQRNALLAEGSSSSDSDSDSTSDSDSSSDSESDSAGPARSRRRSPSRSRSRRRRPTPPRRSESVDSERGGRKDRLHSSRNGRERDEVMRDDRGGRDARVRDDRGGRDDSMDRDVRMRDGRDRDQERGSRISAPRYTGSRAGEQRDERSGRSDRDRSREREVSRRDPRDERDRDTGRKGDTGGRGYGDERDRGSARMRDDRDRERPTQDRVRERDEPRRSPPPRARRSYSRSRSRTPPPRRDQRGGRDRSPPRYTSPGRRPGARGQYQRERDEIGPSGRGVGASHSQKRGRSKSVASSRSPSPMSDDRSSRHDSPPPRRRRSDSEENSGRR